MLQPFTKARAETLELEVQARAAKLAAEQAAEKVRELEGTHHCVWRQRPSHMEIQATFGQPRLKR